MKETSKLSNLLASQHNCITIAASDTSGGAGIQRDLKTFHDIGTKGLSVITGITAQTDNKVYFAEALDETIVDIQCNTLFKNYNISAVKIGVVFNRTIMDTITHYLDNYMVDHVVIDPVLHASDDYSFLNEKDFIHMRDTFLKKATLITPNVPELQRLSDMLLRNEKDLIKAAQFLSKKYDAYVFAKGGHLFNNDEVTDYLVKGDSVERFSYTNIHVSQFHGTGCLISSAITAYLALRYQKKEAIKKAKDYFYTTIHIDA